MPPFIYLNGYPGVGKLTIARELAKLIPSSKVFDNHLIIDPVAAIFERTDPEYQPMRKALVYTISREGFLLTDQRQQLLHAIATSDSTQNTTWIFTDQQSSNPIGTAAVMDYRDAALKRGCPLISVVLDCDMEENLRRATSSERISGLTTKLRDPSIVRAVRDIAPIYRFHDEYELVLDVTALSSGEAAQKIHEHIGKVSRKP